MNTNFRNGRGIGSMLKGITCPAWHGLGPYHRRCPDGL